MSISLISRTAWSRKESLTVYFSIISKDNSEDKFIFECQYTDDDTLLIRIFEYITQEALDSGSINKYKLTVTIPNAAVLFLRSKKVLLTI